MYYVCPNCERVLELKDATLLCDYCGNTYDYVEWLLGEIDDLLEYNRKVTRERDRLLSLKWGLISDDSEDLATLNAFVEMINEYVMAHPDRELALVVTELNLVVEELRRVLNA